MPLDLTAGDTVLAISTFKTDSPDPKTVLFGDTGKVSEVDDNGKGDAWIEWERAGNGRWDEDTITVVEVDEVSGKVVKWNKGGNYGFNNFRYEDEAADVRIGDLAVLELEDAPKGKDGKAIELFKTDRESFASRQGRRMKGRVVSVNLSNSFITSHGVNGDIFAHASNCTGKIVPGMMVEFTVGPGRDGHAVQAVEVCEQGSGKGKVDGKGKAQKGKAPQAKGYQPYNDTGGKGKAVADDYVPHHAPPPPPHVPPPQPPPQPQVQNDETKTRMGKLRMLLDEM
eukprot:gene24856-27893_t